MKDSGTKWIPLIPENWTMKKLKYSLNVHELKGYGDKEVLSLYRELGIVPKNSRDDNHNVTSDDTSKYKYVRKGDFVINKMKAWQGSVAVSNYEGIVSPAYYVYEFSNNNYDKKYFHYLMRNIILAEEFRRISGGIRDGQWDLDRQQFENLYLPLPSKKEQINIAKILDSKCNNIDKLSESISKQIDILEEYKTNKIGEIFDFYKKSYDYKETKLVRISKMITKQTGFDYSACIKPALVTEENEDTLPFIQTKNFKSNYFNFDTDYYIPVAIADKYPKIILDKKCLLFSISGSIGNVGVFPATRKAFLGAAICKVDLIDEELCEYVMFYSLTPTAQQFMDINIYASAQSNITVQNIRDIQIPIFEKTINYQISQKINQFINNIDKIIAEKQGQINVLKEYKKSIIFEYVTGKKQVEE